MPSRSKSRLRSVTEQNKSDRENIGVMVDTKPNIVIVLREKTFIKQGARFSELVFSCNENSILGGRFCIYWKRSVFFVTSDHFIAGAFFIIVLNGRQLQQRSGPVGNGECGKSICNQMLFQVTGVWLSGSVRGVGALLTLWNFFFSGASGASWKTWGGTGRLQERRSFCYCPRSIPRKNTILERYVAKKQLYSNFFTGFFQLFKVICFPPALIQQVKPFSNFDIFLLVL